MLGVFSIKNYLVKKNLETVSIFIILLLESCFYTLSKIIMTRGLPHSTWDNVVLFNNEKIRRERYNDERYFSIVDVVAVLTQSDRPRKYRSDLKSKLISEWSEVSEKIGQLKMVASDGKRYLTDAANTKTILRIIQSVPSPKAEPFKQWLAALWNERIEESNDPELWVARARARAIAVYKSRGMTDDEIKRRISSIETRNELTDEYQARGIVWIEYWILTNLWYWIFDTTAEWIKSKKWLGKHDNPRDHMNKTELLLTELTEETSKNLIKTKNAKWFNQIAPCVEKSVGIVKGTKDAIEQATWKDVLTDFNRLSDRQKSLREKEKSSRRLPKKK